MIDLTRFRRDLKIVVFLLWIFPENMRQKYFLDVLTHPSFLLYCMFCVCFCSNIGDFGLFFAQTQKKPGKSALLSAMQK